MIRPRRRVERERPVVVHLTTTDISLALLLASQLKALDRAGFDVIGLSGTGPFVEYIERDGIRHIPLRNATRSMSLKADVKVAIELWSLLRRLRPDVLHTHNPKPGIYGRIIGAAAGVPVVVNTVHGLYATPSDRWLKRTVVYFLERMAASFSDAEFVQNPEDIETLRQLRVPARRLHLLGNGIDLQRFSTGAVSSDVRQRVRAELGASDTSVVITSVGRLVREKGFPELFAAASRLRLTHPQVVFVVAGPMDSSKKDAISQFDMEEARRAGVRLLGHRADVESIYAASDLFVLASHREGFPRSAMEAAAMGLPIVATDIRGCRQVVDTGVTGLLVPVGDPSALANAVGRLVDDPARRLAMGEAALEKARREFDQEAVIRLILDSYEEMLRRQRRAQPGSKARRTA